MSQWRVAVQPGSALQVLRGVAGTQQSRSGHHRECFPGSQTAILGTLDPAKMRQMTSAALTNLVRWRIPMDARVAKYFKTGYLVVGCNRYYGGLHSRKRDEFAHVRFNGKWKDKILLRTKPQDHSDYFCLRPPPDGLPGLQPFASLETVYAWALRPDEISNEEAQTLEIEVGPFGNWDIDFVGVVYRLKARHRIFISYSSKDKRIANGLWKRLRKSRQRVWIDRVELTAGVSMLGRIAEAIDEVDLVVALLSQNSIRSSWVKTELEIAVTREMNGNRPHIVPVVLDGCRIPPHLSHKRHLGLLLPRRAFSRVSREIIRALRAVDQPVE